MVVNHASSIKLGEGATEPVVLGNLMKTLFNSHTHIGDRGGGTSPPVQKMSGAQLSKKQVKSL